MIDTPLRYTTGLSLVETTSKRACISIAPPAGQFIKHPSTYSQMTPKVLAILTITSVIASSALAQAAAGCALDIPGQRFDLPDRDQALAPLRACYVKHIRLTPTGMDETTLVQQLMNDKCRGETVSLLEDVAGKGVLGLTAQEDRKTVECWARGITRWVRMPTR